MILTCPDCATRYVVDDERVGPQGRAVRCAACGTRWTAMPEAVEAPARAATKPEPAPVFEDFQPNTFDPDAEIADFQADARPLPGDELPRAYRDKVQTQKKVRQAAVTGAIWAGMLGVVVLLIGAAIVLRQDVARLWPRTAGAYAKVGLAVNPTGLAPENVLAGPGLKNGHAAVIVSGVVRNVETRSHDPAPLRVALLDKAGKTLTSQVIELPAGRLQPGQTRPFSTAFLDPPSAAANVQVEFVLDAPAHGKTAGHGEADHHGDAHVATAESTHLRGPAEPTLPPAPAPREAQALPADSPYALPGAAEANTHHPHEG